MRRPHAARAAAALTIAAALLSLCFVAPARAQGISGASASTTGSTGNGGDTSGSVQSSVAFLTNNAGQLQTRFAWNISADVSIASTRDQSGTAVHNIAFTATAPGAYRLDIDTQRTGMIQRNSDASGCDGQAHTSGITASSNVGLTSGTLNLGSPGDVGNGGGDNQIPFNQATSATIVRTSNGAGQSHALTFSWNGSVRSNSCEAAVRQGEGSSVSGCDACIYPGTPSRTQSSDGHFVTITFTSLCGNGSVDGSAGEECDLGAANGSATSCCTSTCQFRASGQQCRAAAGGGCDVAETCSGASASCPADGLRRRARPAGPPRASATSPRTVPATARTVPPTPRRATAPRARPTANPCTLDQCDGSNVTCQRSGGQRGRGLPRVGRRMRRRRDLHRLEHELSRRRLHEQLDAVSRRRRRMRLAENCTGSSAACPADAKKPNGTACTADANPCTLDQCDGSNVTCQHPAGNAGAVCRAAAGGCDAAETCNGTSTDVPRRRVRRRRDDLPRRGRRLRRRGDLRRHEQRLSRRRQAHGRVPRRRPASATSPSTATASTTPVPTDASNRARSSAAPPPASATSPRTAAASAPLSRRREEHRRVCRAAAGRLRRRRELRRRR